MPSTTDTKAIRNITPMKTPMIENPLFSFWGLIVFTARRTASRKDTPLLVTQRFYRIETGGFIRRINAEQESGHGRRRERRDDRRERDVCRDRRERVQQERDAPADQHADETAHHGERRRFDEELPHDLAAQRAERLADADLAGSLGHRDHHDGDD